MEKKIEYTDEITGTEHINIIKDDGSITGMLKSTYEAMQANYLTAPAIMESTQPDEADLTEGNN